MKNDFFYKEIKDNALNKPVVILLEKLQSNILIFSFLL